MTKKRICLLFGGKSDEHEISLQSAKAVYEALDKNKYDITLIGIDKTGRWLLGSGATYLLQADDYKTTQLNIAAMQSVVPVPETGMASLIAQENGQEVGKIDLVMPIMHGPFGEDGRLQGMLEMLGVPYVFSGVLASALGMNKYKAKLIAKDAGLNIAKDIVLTRGADFNLENIISELNFPIVVKPNELGSSVGMTIAKTKEELAQGIELAFEHDGQIILEQFIAGRELTVPVMGNNPPEALPVIEIIPKVSGWFDYKAKYEPGGSEEICPAQIPAEIAMNAQADAVKIFQAIGCADLARVDFIWSEKENKLYFLEINTIPGLTGASLTPKAAKAAGMSFSEFLDKIIEMAIERQKSVKH
jgi:D-alanine-D-alanine ligase